MTTKPTKGERTQARILESARRLFIERGIDAVSIRDIAADAGITHALVHRYFGTRDELLAAVLQHEFETTGATLGARRAVAAPLDAMRDTIAFAFAGGRGLVDLVTQIARAGIAPEAVVGPDPIRPFMDLAEELGSLQARDGVITPAPDPAITALVIAAATTGLATNTPWLMASVGLEPADAEARLPEIVDEILRIATSTLVGPREA